MIIDIIIIFILVILPFINLKKGFLLSCIGFIGSLFSSILTLRILPYFSIFVKENTGAVGFVESFFSNNTVSQGVSVKSKIFEVICSLLSVDTTNGLIDIKDIILNALCFVFLFFFIKICIKIIIKTLSSVVLKVPIISQINSVLGFTLGVVKAFVSIFILCSAVALLSNIPTLSNTLNSQINSSSLYYVFSQSSGNIVDVFLNILA